MLKIKLDKFEGPLDLLLQLIKKEKLDITEISLAHITDQYLEYVKNIEDIAPHEVADFLLIAAQLLHLKSKILLPQTEEETVEEEDLVEKLKIYKEYQKAGKKIMKMLNRKNFLFSRNNLTAKNQIFFSPPPKLGVLEISKAFLGFLAVFKQQVDSWEKGKIIRRVSVEDKIKEINRLLAVKKKLVLKHLYDPRFPKEEKVVSFLAILEIARQGKILIKQKKIFSDIIIINNPN